MKRLLLIIALLNGTSHAVVNECKSDVYFFPHSLAERGNVYAHLSRIGSKKQPFQEVETSVPIKYA